jgi:hypothetical protein
MISATDTFLQYLSTGLGGNPAVHWVRKDATDTTAHLLKHGCLNMSILRFSNEGSMEEALVSLDILSSGEREAWQWAKTVRNKLIEQQYTSELDFEAAPDSPVPLGQLVSWQGREIDFDIIVSDANYVHLNATFNICHARQTDDA